LLFYFSLYNVIITAEGMGYGPFTAGKDVRFPITPLSASLPPRTAGQNHPHRGSRLPAAACRAAYGNVHADRTHGARAVHILRPAGAPVPDRQPAEWGRFP